MTKHALTNIRVQLRFEIEPVLFLTAYDQLLPRSLLSSLLQYGSHRAKVMQYIVSYTSFGMAGIVSRVAVALASAKNRLE